ncbi:MAG: hypothetical protein JW820_08675 [Spirochaetales bacterium]|nr:hypothetical protein [Spirochaetales bacterium]
MDKKFRDHFRAFLLSHQIGEDPYGNLAKIKVIANSNPAKWDGKLPSRGIDPDPSFCKVVEASRSRPVVPWWWYQKEKEPVPAVVQDVYEGLAFDFALLYPQENVWIYIVLEPSVDVIELLRGQEHLKAFILISLINKRFPPAQREHQRLRLGTVLKSKDLNKIFTFVAFREEDAAYASLPPNLPTVSRLVHASSNTANWSIRLPRDRHVYGSFREIVVGR